MNKQPAKVLEPAEFRQVLKHVQNTRPLTDDSSGEWPIDLTDLEINCVMCHLYCDTCRTGGSYGPNSIS